MCTCGAIVYKSSATFVEEAQPRIARKPARSAFLAKPEVFVGGQRSAAIMETARSARRTMVS
jgi:hypothetical protein